MAQVYELAGRDEWDLLVVDTPPTRHALDFLEAPRRLIELLDGTGLGILLRATSFMNRMSFGMLARSRDQFARVFEALTGHRLLVDLNAFFEEFADIIDGFRARATRLQDMLRGPESAFVLVLAPQSDLAAAADAYLTRLRSERMQVPLAVFNQVHRIRPCDQPARVRATAAGAGLSADLVQRLFACHKLWSDRAQADAAVVERWNDGVRPPALAIERYERGIGTLAELERFANDLCPSA
jgi:anion-transporting  ArsA/GET3 family ATPase